MSVIKTHRDVANLSSAEAILCHWFWNVIKLYLYFFYKILFSSRHIMYEISHGDNDSMQTTMRYFFIRLRITLDTILLSAAAVYFMAVIYFDDFSFQTLIINYYYLRKFILYPKAYHQGRFHVFVGEGGRRYNWQFAQQKKKKTSWQYGTVDDCVVPLL